MAGVCRLVISARWATSSVRAVCLIKERSLAEACRLAGRTYLQVPEAHRTEILGSRARAVIDVLPPRLRSVRAVRELGEILALPPGAM
ncbi:hypothetical protein OG535_34435 [Kitasatospora sp. NBC_00085]|uniref:hypothetical protein n=1 Tax=unclassified Kitasatospora TaxID=2633591 RepID=UPI003255AAFB